MSPETKSRDRAMLWTGRALSLIFVLFMAMDIAVKLMVIPPVTESFAQLGFADDGLARPIGLIELACVLLYLFPRTWTLGCILMMGVLGGAMGVHLRAQDPLASHVLFSVYLGLFMWGGVWLRDARLRAVFPLRR